MTSHVLRPVYGWNVWTLSGNAVPWDQPDDWGGLSGVDDHGTNQEAGVQVLLGARVTA